MSKICPWGILIFLKKFPFTCPCETGVVYLWYFIDYSQRSDTCLQFLFIRMPTWNKRNLWKKEFPHENLIQSRDDAPGNLQQWKMQSGLQRDNHAYKLSWVARQSNFTVNVKRLTHKAFRAFRYWHYIPQKWIILPKFPNIHHELCFVDFQTVENDISTSTRVINR